MKDRIQLLLVSLFFAAFAWAFWRIAGRDGFLILIALTNFALISENRRLKQTQRNHPAQQAGASLPSGN